MKSVKGTEVYGDGFNFCITLCHLCSHQGTETFTSSTLQGSLEPLPTMSPPTTPAKRKHTILTSFPTDQFCLLVNLT